MNYQGSGILKIGFSKIVYLALSLLEFTVPTAFPDNIPKFIRPDWDSNITDIPSGCATEGFFN